MTYKEYVHYCLPFLLGERKEYHHYEIGDVVAYRNNLHYSPGKKKIYLNKSFGVLYETLFVDVSIEDHYLLDFLGLDKSVEIIIFSTTAFESILNSISTNARIENELLLRFL